MYGLSDWEDAREISPHSYDHQGGMEDWLMMEKIEDVAAGTSKE